MSVRDKHNGSRSPSPRDHKDDLNGISSLFVSELLIINRLVRIFCDSGEAREIINDFAGYAWPSNASISIVLRIAEHIAMNPSLSTTPTVIDIKDLLCRLLSDTSSSLRIAR